MILTIGKPAKFEENGLPIRGQCQPYSHDWQLKFFEKGATTIVFEGTYYICRQLQIECREMSSLESIRKKVDQIQEEFLDDTQETAVITESSRLINEEEIKDSSGTIAIPKNEMEDMAGKNRKHDENEY